MRLYCMSLTPVCEVYLGNMGLQGLTSKLGLSVSRRWRRSPATAGFRTVASAVVCIKPFAGSIFHRWPGKASEQIKLRNSSPGHCQLGGLKRSSVTTERDLENSMGVGPVKARRLGFRCVGVGNGGADNRADEVGHRLPVWRNDITPMWIASLWQTIRER